MTTENKDVPASPWAAWLTGLIVSSARDLEKAGRACHRFESKILEAFEKRPIQKWEADRWFRGLKLRLIRTADYFFRAGAGKRAPLSLFVRNAAGLNVGLRREAITQAATYITLVTDYGYPRGTTRFESRWMDVVVYDPDRPEAGDIFEDTFSDSSPRIYAENKAEETVLRKLCGRLETEFATHVPVVEEPEPGNHKAGDDALMKAHHIWVNRPRFFWAVSPTLRQAYRVDYGDTGFRLFAEPDIPHAAG